MLNELIVTLVAKRTKMLFPKKVISSVIKSSRVAQIEYNCKVLSSIVSSAIFCRKQNIALRGHMESGTDNNSKN